MKFTLNFKSDNYGLKQIDEPFGTSDINFSLKQKEKGMGRDVSFSGDEIQFEFTDMRNHELKQLLYYNRKFGFEAVVVLTIEIDNLNKYNCDLDFATAETDDLTYFRCKGIEDGKLQIVKARKSVKVDLLSDVDVDGNYIGGLVPDNMLLLAKPVVQMSKWEQQNDFYKELISFDIVHYQINPCLNMTDYGLEDSFTFFEPSSVSLNTFTNSDFMVITAKNNIRNIKINIKDLLIDFTTDYDGHAGCVDFSLEIRYGIDYATAQKQNFLSTTKTENQSYSFNGDVFCEIPFLNRGDYIWVFLSFRVVRSLNFALPFVYLNVKNMKVTITTESTAYNSISKSLRLVDVIRQVIKSISGLQINAERFDALGQFYDNRLVNGNFLRGIIDKPFYISLEDIEKSMTEVRGDWEIRNDGKIFFGIEEDFYTNVESGFFNNIQFSEMNKTFNPKYMINEFGFKYKNYQSLKENEEPNSADTIHGESKFVFFNKSVENKKEVEVDWTRDAFLIESTRRKALEFTEKTASQDDDTIFCIDSIETTFDNKFTEVTQLEHAYSPPTNRLTIRNDGSINFVSLGIAVDSVFIIEQIDVNAGTYRVFSVNTNSIELTRLIGVVSGSGNGNRLTKYTYTLTADFVPFTNYTNQGFTETENLGSADNYSNRRYSIKSNIYNYWKSYLATANLYWKNNPLKNTWYKNNGDYTAKYNGVKLTEKDDFIPDNPILSPMLYNNIIFKNVDFADFIALQNSIRSERGYIRTIDNNQQVIKVYPIDMEYSLLEKELQIKAEEKFEPTTMTISTEFDYILINNETRVLSLQWEIIGEKLFIYDENRYRLYNGVYWMEVSINGAVPNSIEQLENWLSLVN